MRGTNVASSGILRTRAANVLGNITSMYTKHNKGMPTVLTMVDI